MPVHLPGGGADFGSTSATISTNNSAVFGGDGPNSAGVLAAFAAGRGFRHASHIARGTGWNLAWVQQATLLTNPAVGQATAETQTKDATMFSSHRRSMFKAAMSGAALFASPRLVLSQTSDLQAANRLPSRLPDPRNPVFYWNARSLELVAKDHSVLASEAVAPGPCASSRALGIIHAVIADAVSYTYPSRFRAQFNNDPPRTIDADPALFVGGAAHAVMGYIYDKDVFTADILGPAKADFLSLFGGSSGQNTTAWDAGAAFGTSQAFRDLWNAADVISRIRDQSYTPASGKHDVDPWNPGQGFYGLKWGDEPALALGDADFVRRFSQGEFPAAPQIDQDELDYLVAKGSRYPRAAGNYRARTEGEKRIGLFWAYDGTRLLGTPPVLYNKAVSAVAQFDKLDIPDAARLLALCNLAMADAAIVAWEAKWRIALWRPVRAIQALRERGWQPCGSPRSNRNRFGASLAAAGAQADTAETLLGASPADNGALARPGLSDPEYSLAAFTPNFPSYPSGHATFGGACFQAVVNARQEYNRLPNNVNVTLRSSELSPETTDNYTLAPRPDYPFQFRRLLQPNLGRGGYDTGTMTGSNDASRVFLGVHWRFDQTDGDKVGRKVGDLVYARAYPLMPG